MNIKIVHSWLTEYLKTNASPDEIRRYLSLSGPSVERVEKINGDYVYDIEITSNRVDSGSVLGISQECQAILPIFGKKAHLKFKPLDKFKFSQLKTDFHHPLTLNIAIKDKDLCSRFSALVLDQIKIGPSPDFMKKRLNLCGIKAINNVVDISNYLMIALGQPVHLFDYDKIGQQKMIMRKSERGEKIVTLDGKEIELPGGDIVIEDGRGKLIDLCGIMGGLNSAISKKTTRAVLFVQTYNKAKIRRTTMLTSQRTVAATYFEKGLDETRVEPTLVYGVQLLKKYAAAKVASPIYDIYPHPYKEKTIVINKAIFKKIIGLRINLNQVRKILKNLGFQFEKSNSSSTLKIKIPSYRQYDVTIPEDIVEEVARIYGYDNLPGHLPPAVHIDQPKELEKFFKSQNKIKYFLKHLGLHETMNYSMISKKLIEKFSLNKQAHLHLTNTISQEIEYMRKTLIPSLAKNIEDNFGRRKKLNFFEMAKIYQPRKDDLPQETVRLAIAVNSNFFDLKGIVQALLTELNIVNVDWRSSIKKNLFYTNSNLFCINFFNNS